LFIYHNKFVGICPHVPVILRPKASLMY